ncbi:MULTISPECIES: DUF4229 domain-containing protein [unclassified Streptomyces]|uniref:DUF4229 domain-containing protein n=1 Tax=Streptomycetaceae TaxID=2062 RepID=UPI002E7A4576|nr:MULTISPECIES: DUF4229 domain-containing protein [unclassified Streptomyces]MED7955406.1 DUF4229 domain-containing protein [Streptomyces sp. BE303]MEE1827096.1 DUF4229 domain-containing protein [Streptomyces sp. BE20]
MSSTVSKKSHATLRYTSMRVSIFLGCLLVALLLGHFQVIPVKGQSGTVFLFLLAALVSAPLSYVLLHRQRDDMSAEISGRVDGIRTRTAQKIAAQNAEEDAADDAARSAAATSARTAAAPN